MAFGGHQYGGSFTNNCLDDIPFKLGPKFKTPSKIVLPPDLAKPFSSRALDADYSFEVEEAVLKWSVEREKQLAEQQRLEKEFSESARKEVTNAESHDGADGPLYENHSRIKEPLYENAHSLPKPAPPPRPKSRPGSNYANVLIPNPLIANISNGILQPTPSSSSVAGNNDGTDGGGKKSDSDKTAKSSDIDLTWFEQEDDPFDNLELQTINDLEELASVLEETKQVSPVPVIKQTTVDTGGTVKTETVHNGVGELEEGGENVYENVAELDENHESPVYENVELKLVDLKVHTSDNASQSVLAGTGMSGVGNLPPVPPRRDLVGRSPPLPPIGLSSNDPIISVHASHSLENNVKEEQSKKPLDSEQTFQNHDSSKLISKRRAALPKPLPKPPRTFSYGRQTEETEEENDQLGESKYENLQPKVSISDIGKQSSVQFTNNHVSKDSRLVRSSSEELTFVAHHYGGETCAVAGDKGSNVRPRPQRPAPVPPARPQSWGKFSPLPPSSRQSGAQPAAKESPKRVMPDPGSPARSPDLYSRLSKEAQGCVDRLTSMGFPKDRVSRAVQQIGQDEKEVVEYLCLVDQLIEKGYHMYLAENALLLFHNSMQQACTYLELFKQMQELGFSGDKIKEALISSNNDREKALDILTASS